MLSPPSDRTGASHGNAFAAVILDGTSSHGDAIDLKVSPEFRFASGLLVSASSSQSGPTGVSSHGALVYRHQKRCIRCSEIGRQSRYMGDIFLTKQAWESLEQWECACSFCLQRNRVHGRLAKLVVFHETGSGHAFAAVKTNGNVVI